jgi:hypothetical protein
MWIWAHFEDLEANSGLVLGEQQLAACTGTRASTDVLLRMLVGAHYTACSVWGHTGGVLPCLHNHNEQCMRMQGQQRCRQRSTTL